MELLNGAYLAGVSVMKPGASSRDVFTATLGYIEQRQNELKTPMAKEAAASALKRKGYALHGLGVDMAEGAPQTFRAGNVLCYEPQLTSGNQAFFVEDTFLITAAGHEVINPALPYSPGDIEKAMSQSSPQSK